MFELQIHFEDDIRGMTVSPTLTFDDFVDKVCAKFNRSPSNLLVKFADEDGNKVSLIDDSDYDLALEVARDSAKGKPEGKLEMWCIKR
jgi:neutrophil factor 2